MFVSASGEFNPAAAGRRASGHAALANALVSATRSLGAVKRAFSHSKPTAAHENMIAASRQLAADAASVIVTAIHGTALNDPETVCILFELFLMRDVSRRSCEQGLALPRSKLTLSALVATRSGARHTACCVNISFTAAARSDFSRTTEQHCSATAFWRTIWCT